MKTSARVCRTFAYLIDGAKARGVGRQQSQRPRADQLTDVIPHMELIGMQLVVPDTILGLPTARMRSEPFAVRIVGHLQAGHIAEHLHTLQGEDLRHVRIVLEAQVHAVDRVLLKVVDPARQMHLLVAVDGVRRGIAQMREHLRGHQRSARAVLHVREKDFGQVHVIHHHGPEEQIADDVILGELLVARVGADQLAELAILHGRDDVREAFHAHAILLLFDLRVVVQRLDVPADERLEQFVQIVRGSDRFSAFGVRGRDRVSQQPFLSVLERQR